MSGLVAEQAGLDFFVSYTTADRAWAEWIAWELEDSGFRVLLQAWDFISGSSWVHMMDTGVRLAERTVVVLSDSYLNSAFGAAEWQAAWRADPTERPGSSYQFESPIVSRLAFWQAWSSIDLFDATESEARMRLRAAATTAEPSQPSRRRTQAYLQRRTAHRALRLDRRSPPFSRRSGISLPAIPVSPAGRTTLTACIGDSR